MADERSRISRSSREKTDRSDENDQEKIYKERSRSPHRKDHESPNRSTSRLSPEMHLQKKDKEKRERIQSLSSSNSDDDSSSSDSEERSHKHKKHSKKKDKHDRKSKKTKKEKSKKKEKRKRKHSESKGPVQLSKFITEKSAPHRSAVSGKVIKMKVKKTRGDKEREINRQQLLDFLNASM